MNEDNSHTTFPQIKKCRYNIYNTIANEGKKLSKLWSQINKMLYICVNLYVVHQAKDTLFRSTTLLHSSKPF